jgi:hypothetical protein
MRLWMRITIIVTLPLLLAGCRREEPASGRTPAPAAESTGTAASTDTALTTADAKLAVEEPIAVSIIEGGVVIEGSPLAGATDFQVTNNGNQVHSLAIEGGGVTHRLETNLQPFEIQTLRVLDLRPGRYQVFCPFPGHSDDGETAVMDVAAPEGEE